MQNLSKLLALVVLSGLLIGLSLPGMVQPLLGLIGFVPLLIAIDLIAKQEITKSKKALKILLACYLSGAVISLVGCRWMVHSMMVFGNLPSVLSNAIVFFGYGLEAGGVLFFAIGLWAVFNKSGGEYLLLRILLMTIVDLYYPRLIEWQYGNFSLANMFPLNQMMALVGKNSLAIIAFGCNFLVFSIIRNLMVKSDLKKDKNSIKLTLGLATFTIFGLVYGVNVMESINELKSDKNEATLKIISIQPDFSQGYLAYHRDRIETWRPSDFRLLLSDSVKALKKVNDKALEKVLIWPESTFKFALLKDKEAQKIVSEFAKKYNVSILLQSIDWQKQSDGSTKTWAFSALIDYDGMLQGRYNKMTLIPFGEYIPLADKIPFIRKLILATTQNTSEFERGEEYTVFKLGSGKQVSATICFDAFSGTVIPNMVSGGAQVVFNLSNLGWFGRTNATNFVETTLRVKAIENRVSIVNANNTGRSMVLNNQGQVVSKIVGQFTQGQIIKDIALKPTGTFYSKNRTLIEVAFLALLILLGARHFLYLKAKV